MQYEFIKNPETGRYESIYGKLGQTVLYNYLEVYQYGGISSDDYKQVVGGDQSLDWWDFENMVLTLEYEGKHYIMTGLAPTKCLDDECADLVPIGEYANYKQSINSGDFVEDVGDALGTQREKWMVTVSDLENDKEEPQGIITGAIEPCLNPKCDPTDPKALIVGNLYITVTKIGSQAGPPGKYRIIRVDKNLVFGKNDCPYCGAKEGWVEEWVEVLAREAEEAQRRGEEVARPVQVNKERCFKCRKKVGLVGASTGLCRCEYVFCGMCRAPEDHACDFDWKKRGKDVLTKTVGPKITFSKVDRI